MKFSFTLFTCIGMLLFASGCSSTAQVKDDAPEAETKISKSTVITPVLLQAVPDITSQKVGCDGNMDQTAYYYNVNGEKVSDIKINATGFGAPPKSFYSEPQRRLMAMRAAKIDAYRSLAERIYGMQIWGGTTVGDMVIEKDRFRVYLDTHLRGARVIAENQQEDGTYETIVEIEIDQNLLKVGLPKPKDPCADRNDSKTKTSNQRTIFRDASFPDRDNRRDTSANSNFYYRVD